MVSVAQQLEQIVSLGIFLVALVLAILSGLAYRRERDRRMLVVAGAYLLFAVYGLVVFLEYVLLPFLSFELVEILEHGAAILILIGLLAFFAAMR